MPVTSPDHWFLETSQTRRSPAYTRGNTVTPFVDGMGYMADLQKVLGSCDDHVLLSGWRMTSEQRLSPRLVEGRIEGETLIDAVASAGKRGCSIKALLFNVPGTEAPGPFRMWHAEDNFAFARAVKSAGGEVVLDSRLPAVPASAHHQKFIVATSKDATRDVAYLGGIDVCLDRWDRPAHDAAAERQCDYLRVAGLETHTLSQPGWHDLQAKVQGPAVSQIWAAFQERWNDPRPANHNAHLRDFRSGSKLGSAPECPAAGTKAVQVNQTLAPEAFPFAGAEGELTVRSAHERAIDRAEKFIYVEDQYVWPCSLVDRLERALERGVHILLVVARDYDAPGLAPIAKRLRHQVVDRLRRAGSGRFQIFHLERDDGKQIYVHSKVMIVDDCYASIGSANFNARSLTNDTELQIGIVDEDLVEAPFAGQPERVCRFAHELRCALWAEHLELGLDKVRDPMLALETLWPNAPVAPSVRARKHDASLVALALDPIAEHLTTVISEGMAHIPLVQLPNGVTHRSIVKLAVDTALRGPQGALLLKAAEELLNPDVAPAVAQLWSSIAPALLPTASTAAQGNPLGDQIVRKLKSKELPQMVDWFDPGLLVRIGIRDLISGTIGQYADQRLMQAASDHVASEQDLVARYDYSDPYDPRPGKRLEMDEQGRVWVDYVADLGDGFEATYAVAHLMGKPRLDVAGSYRKAPSRSLPAGQILIMGGDQAYPQATQQEYQARLIDPYDWAFTTDRPRRKLFAIPGNHDWYDGLNAFTSLFTSARDRITGGIGKQLGAWRCQQHRSYWALKLPYDWWIWGPDIQLEGNLDDPQRDYFDIVSDSTRPGDKIIICLAEPSWHHENYDNLHEISMLARKKGAKICAVLAGDWHHYSRYTNSKLGVQFITCGGGGAFAHATHQLKDRLDLEWAEVTANATRQADPADPLAFNRMEQGIVKAGDHVDYGMKDYSLDVAATQAADVSPGGASRSGQKGSFNLASYSHHTRRIYPSKGLSRLLSLKNLALPFRNTRFALLVGAIYFLYAWIFQVSAPPIDVKAIIPAGKVAPQEALSHVATAFWSAISPERVLAAMKANPLFFFLVIGLWLGLVSYVELGKGLLNAIGKFVIGSAHFVMHLAALLIVNLVALLPALPIAGMLILLLGGSLSQGGQSIVSEISFLASYAVMSILIGGLAGAFIMGLYWTVTSVCFNMHCGDAFGALGIRNYKHFLRMSFEPDRVTIYPIAIDKVPGRRGWRASTADERAKTPSQIVPKSPLRPHLIEEPIEIDAATIRP